MNTYVEKKSELSPECVSNARAYASLIEELEAITFYQQRSCLEKAEYLSEIFLHNAKEEKEHAAMLLEWIRRNDNTGEWNDVLKKFLFTTGKIEVD